MKTEFILGDAAQDFEKAVAQRTAEFIKDDPLRSVLIITPPQATSSTEQMILNELGERLGTKGVMGVDIASIHRTALKILSETCGNVPKTLSAAGKSMVIKEVLNKNKESIKALITKSSSYDLPSMIVKTIEELKSQNIAPDELSSINSDNVKIKNKLDDLALIYSEYNEKTADYADMEDRIQKAAECADKSEYIKDTDVIIYDFDFMPKNVINFVKAIMRNAKSTTITFLNPDKDAPDKSVYDISRRMRKALESTAKEGDFTVTYLPDPADMPKKAADIIYAAENLFSRKPPKEAPEQNGAVIIGKAADKKEEVDGVIAQIVRLNAEKGIPYNKIALVCGSASEYLPIIRHRFNKAGLPCYTGDKRSLADSNLASLVITAFKLSIAGKPSKNLILEHAATGFTALKNGQRYNLENYAYEHIVNGLVFLKEFEKPWIEESRRLLMDPIIKLREETKKADTVSEWIDCVLDYLEQLGIKNKLQRKINKMSKCGHLQDADYHEQALKRISEVLGEAKKICGNAAKDKEFIGVFEAGLAAEEIAVIPQTRDEVVCGDIYNLYIPDVDALFILGMNMGSIPDYKSENGILSEKERDLIFNADEEFSAANITETRKLDILKAVSRPKERLYLSYTENASDRPSLLMDRISKMFESAEPIDLAKAAPIVKNTAKELFSQRMRSAADGIPTPDWGLEYELAVYTDEESKDEVEKLKNIKASADYQLKLNKDIAEKLYPKDPLSVTRIENYYNCPYKYFVKYGLKLKEMQEAEVKDLDRGNFAHKMLELIVDKMNGKSWDEITDGEYAGIIDESKAEAIKETPAYNYSDANEVILEGISEAVKDSAYKVKKFASEGLMKPGLAELNFKNKEDSNKINGKVDRIDIAELNGEKYFGIVDYKSSSYNDFDINKFYGKINLQLIFYLTAIRDLLENDYIPAGAAYFEIALNWNEADDKAKGILLVDKDTAKALYGTSVTESAARHFENEKEYLIKYLNKLIDEAKNAIETGDISIAPAVYEDKKCDFCDYRSICFKDKDDKTNDRIIEKLGKAEVMERIIEEIGEEDAAN